MSYLGNLRLHFAGRFQANVSTVNNDPGHFDNAIFQPEWQAMEGIGMNPPNGWFNPEGDADWRFLGCRVTSAWMPTTTSPSVAVPSSDPVLACLVADSDAKAPAKLVDLDPEQQLVSEIWGLQVRIVDGAGNTLLRGDYDPAAFIDIWDRATVSAGGDADAGAMYQSILTNLVWGDVSGSPFLLALQTAAADGVLSIKFNVDAFNLDYASPEFMTGRITGTIGPAAAGDPKHMLFGRQFMAGASVGGNFYTPPGKLNYCVAVVDATNNLIHLDLGNAIPTGAGGSMVDLGDLQLSVLDPITTPGNPAGTTIPIGTVASSGTGGYASDPDWYARTAGVVTLSIPSTPTNLLAMIQSSPLSIVSTGTSGANISEWPSCAFVRADRFVHRLSPGQPAQDIQVYAMRYGQPVPAGTQIAFVADASQLQTQVGSGFPFVTDSPAVATPDVLGYTTPIATTDASGAVVLSVTATDPGPARNFNKTTANPDGDYGIDGQVYGVRPGFVDTATYGDSPINQWNFISFLVFSAFAPKVPGNPTWYDDLQPIFQQYANLYPVMNRFLNLADYDSVATNARLLNLAFGLDPSNPNSMPVTRDLSPAKRAAILQWLGNGLPMGTPPAATTALRAAPPTPTPPASTSITPTPAQRGGKAMAAARRLVLRDR